MYLCISMTVTVEALLSLGMGSSAPTLVMPGVVCDGWGRPRIPGEQVCAKARDAAERLARNIGLRPPEGRGQHELIAAIFGADDRRSTLRFADLPGAPGLPELRQRKIRAVALERRAAEGGHLLVEEPTLDLFHAARAITGTLESLPQIGLLWAALRLAASHGIDQPEPGWASLDLEVRCASDGPPDLAAPPLHPVELGRMLRQIARPG